MGSRAVFSVHRDASGAIHTRTGRGFFDAATEREVLGLFANAAAGAGLWDELNTDWLLLDAEIMPWSAKAIDLIRSQYAAVGTAARSALPATLDVLAQAAARGIDTAALTERAARRADNAEGMRAVYRRYSWPVSGVEGLSIAPFQLLASDGTTYEHRDHLWHLSLADRLVEADPTLFATTRRLVVNTTNDASVAAGIAWWSDLTTEGGEGMVVKPLVNFMRGPKGLVQPGIKVRGREYLRLIYGPDYTEPANLKRLRNRNLGLKRSMALREYALGLEALKRATSGEPAWRVHECVFAVLAMESEPVDPRL